MPGWNRSLEASPVLQYPSISHLSNLPKTMQNRAKSQKYCLIDLPIFYILKHRSLWECALNASGLCVTVQMVLLPISAGRHWKGSHQSAISCDCRSILLVGLLRAAKWPNACLLLGGRPRSRPSAGGRGYTDHEALVSLFLLSSASLPPDCVAAPPLLLWLSVCSI